MIHKFQILTSLLIVLLFSACGEISTTTNQASPTPSPSAVATPNPPTPSSTPKSDSTPTPVANAVNISGTIKYERARVIHSSSSSRLDFSNLKINTAKQIMVKLIDASGDIVDSSYTDNQGKYTFYNLPKNTKYKIRVYAKMFKTSLWDVKVIDNTQGGSLYAIEGSMISTGNSNTIRNLTASAENRGSPPFAILDSIYQAMQKVYQADNRVRFAPLKLNWSVNNIETSTYYDGVDNIIISGDQRGDSDEYDGHIIIHEWAHFFENTLSRADNIGGSHGNAQYLDIRVAFGEGFGNAFSAIVTDDPIYYDTMGSTGWNMNIESSVSTHPGWFSEVSIQHIIYDLYDGNIDGIDTLALGFKPIYNVLVGAQKRTEAFTSIFSFIYALKNENSTSSTEINDIVSSENIAPIHDVYGENRTLSVVGQALPLYRTLDIGGNINVCTSNTYGTQRFPGNNKLNHHKYVRFNISTENTYHIQVQQSNGRSADPDFILFKTSPFENLLASEDEGTESTTVRLTKGNYLLDISDAKNIALGCFNVSIN
jgi:uncharacterized lipoprotein YehR (DUF1307 family)